MEKATFEFDTFDGYGYPMTNGFPAFHIEVGDEQIRIRHWAEGENWQWKIDPKFITEEKQALYNRLGLDITKEWEGPWDYYKYLESKGIKCSRQCKLDYLEQIFEKSEPIDAYTLLEMGRYGDDLREELFNHYDGDDNGIQIILGREWTPQDVMELCIGNYEEVLDNEVN